MLFFLYNCYSASTQELEPLCAEEKVEKYEKCASIAKKNQMDFH